ncbi:MAG: 16S rRNA (cytosine(1402)-N(4))-methyltransferase [Caulobacter vibrioides]|uniref:Ribosomal RNA small subunit methyltransferase H n=1 Tax=Caulobacter vibrioides TaxID=155892 RepID=A0A258D8L6_CAUVI|nr:MAG: 16S rRNA (cytosine(1402)-N(4))-methyltransferase [Caulobacter vibrioides]
MSDAPHLSVLLDEVVEAMAPAPGRRLVDATFGAGGYTRALLEAGADVVAFDRDPSAARFAGPLAEAFPGRFTLVQRRFSELEEGLADAGLDRCDGVCFDLGVSSMQLDEAERGFSFMRDGPLDMRMGDEGPSAADLVNSTDETELAHLIWTLGDERGSRKIAKYIVNRRAERPFERTLDLAHVVEKALGGRKGAPVHPATRTFQALRIAVNEELAELQAGLDAAERVLAPGGRLVVVTFHSLEDRIAKGYFAERAGKTPGGSRHLPPAQAGPPPSFDLLFNGARSPSQAEVARNPRARSAKLRAGVRTASPAWRRAA